MLLPQFWTRVRFTFFWMRPCQTVTCLVTQCLLVNLSVSWSQLSREGLFHEEPHWRVMFHVEQP